MLLTPSFFDSLSSAWALCVTLEECAGSLKSVQTERFRSTVKPLLSEYFYKLYFHKIIICSESCNRFKKNVWKPLNLLILSLEDQNDFAVSQKFGSHLKVCPQVFLPIMLISREGHLLHLTFWEKPELWHGLNSSS